MRPLIFEGGTKYGQHENTNARRSREAERAISQRHKGSVKHLLMIRMQSKTAGDRATVEWVDDMGQLCADGIAEVRFR